MTVTENSIETFVTEWNTWHAAREATFGEPLGWLSLTALHWLTETDATFDDLPGAWRADADEVVLTAAAQDEYSLDGVAVEGVVTLAPVEGAPGVIVAQGARLVEVIRRTGDVGLRVHDSAAPGLARYSGIPTFEPRAEWVVAGVFTAYDEVRTVTTGAVVEGLEHHHAARGTISFVRDGDTHQLIAFAGKDSGFQILFTDATSGVSTYPAARALLVDAPREDGTVVLDFNRASNLPCAFTDFATCPVAPPENRLAVAVEAGEKTPERN